MTIVKFNPTDAEDRAAAKRIIDLFDDLADYSGNVSRRALLTGENPSKPVQSEQPVATPETTTTETPEQPAAPEQPDDAVDVHGMKWDPEIHASTKAFNADGSWKARRGRADELAAAIAAHKSAQNAAAGAAMTASVTEAAPAQTTEQPAATGMPSAPTEQPAAMPAAPAPTAPAAPVTYEEVATRFVGMMQQDKLPVPYEDIYAALSVSYDDLQTNQTSLRRLKAYMDSVDQGGDHGAATQAALAAA